MLLEDFGSFDDICGCNSPETREALNKDCALSEMTIDGSGHCSAANERARKTCGRPER